MDTSEGLECHFAKGHNFLDGFFKNPSFKIAMSGHASISQVGGHKALTVVPGSSQG